MNLYRATQQLAAGARGTEGEASQEGFAFPDEEFEKWRKDKAARKGGAGDFGRRGGGVERGKERERGGKEGEEQRVTAFCFLFMEGD